MNWFMGFIIFCMVIAIIKWVYKSIYESWVARRVNYAKIWSDYYVDAKKYYASKYKNIPNIMYIGNIDTSAACSYLINSNDGEIVEIKQHCYYDAEQEGTFFNCTIMELKNKRIVEVGNNFVFLYYDKNSFIWANNMIASMKKFIIVEEVNKKDVVKVVGFAKQAAMN